jgi:thiol-disulfide isomerase/thioredoxin
MQFAVLFGFVASLAPQGQALLAGSRKPGLDSPAGVISSIGLRCNVSDAPAVYDFAITGDGEAPAELSKEDKRKELKGAIKEYKVEAVKFEAAESRLGNAMEALLEVPSVDGPALTKLLSAKSNTLVVFYAPWCGHCQKFVLSDGNGNPSEAPLEVFRRQLAQTEATKHVSVVRYDTQEHGGSFPPVFEVVGIPTVYFVDSAGAATQYAADPHDLAGLRKFVEANMK